MGHDDNFPVTVGDLDTATLLMLSCPASTPRSAPLRTLALELDDVDGSSPVDQLWAHLRRHTRHASPDRRRQLGEGRADSYPLIGPYAVDYAMGGCVLWPAGRQLVTGTHLTARPHPGHRDPATITPFVGAVTSPSSFSELVC